ncbi:PAS domain-containing protein [Mucilaginibacter pallidiroseus]|uniref:histidine kinase n=1 Tax=Mucilaginibacter pallidiroseus TaxID=2599295 RepID=A0A563U842_9SPHI|nr:PAS domain-containing sensor histidine kinase [Mucilaginibacter pallidiroseus]TWR27551.1 PAS domain-containing protein [Mucilaginibacter pallidiroseus]
MSFKNGTEFTEASLGHFTRLIDKISSGLWEYNAINKKTTWSNGFYTMLGYEVGELECTHTNFFENILYYADKNAFLKTNTENSTSPVSSEIRLLTKNGGYQWFKSIAYKSDSKDTSLYYGMLTNINADKLTRLNTERKNFIDTETGRIAKIGGWELDVTNRQVLLTTDVYRIFELEDGTPITLDEAISFFEPNHRSVVANAVEDAINLCKSFDIEVLFRTARNNVIWVRSKCVPIVDDFGHCILLRGIFQNIDAIKKRGLNMQSSINMLDDKNKRLQNFAYMVSHNLRSHAGNLAFMVDLYENDLTEDRDEIFGHIKTISGSLSATMSHLDEVVRIQSDIQMGLKDVKFVDMLTNSMRGLSANIQQSEAVIDADFSRCQQIAYIPAYLESIFHNMITNAIKYQHPKRKPVIVIKSFIENNKVFLTFQDNGLGIDLKRHGEDIFGMYKTFHQHKDAKGIGLFITRNQVEALGGSINVESTLNNGTKFTIMLVHFNNNL